MRDGYWLVLSRSYLSLGKSQAGREDKHNMFFCPTVTQIDYAYGGKGQNPSSAWHYTCYDNNYYSSFGFNTWIYDYKNKNAYQDRPGQDMWRTVNVQVANNIPALTACFHGGSDNRYTPPEYSGQRWAGGHNNEMRRSLPQPARWICKRPVPGLERQKSRAKGTLDAEMA